MRRCLYVLLLSFLVTGIAPRVHAGQARDAGVIAQARDRFQHDLVTLLALRSTAQSLLGAALLARPLHTVGGPLDFHHLITRAARAEDAGPAVNWVRLSDCDALADTCPNAQALAALRAQAPDNAAVWLLLMGQAEHNGDTAAAQRDLARAAAARHYDDYTGRSLQALAVAVSLLPPPEATLSGQGTHAAQVADLRVTLVYGIGDAQPLPGFHLVAEHCAPGAVAGHAKLRQTCLDLAHVLEWGSNPLARSLGLHLRDTLATQADVREDARAAMQDLVWQVHAFGRLGMRARSDPQTADLLLRLARKGGTEMSQMRAAIQASGLPIVAPADGNAGTAVDGRHTGPHD